jgi:hypothetical protein
MKYMRKTADCSWIDYETRTEIEKEINMTPLLDKLQEYRRNWIRLVNSYGNRRKRE